VGAWVGGAMETAYIQTKFNNPKEIKAKKRRM